MSVGSVEVCRQVSRIQRLTAGGLATCWPPAGHLGGLMYLSCQPWFMQIAGLC